VPQPVIPQPVTEGWQWNLPAGFPPPPVPTDNPMSAVKVELGRRLFHDPRLSGNGTLSCASCHRPEWAFTDGRAGAIGSTDEVHPRSAMSLANVAYNATLTWADETVVTLEQQAHIPLLNEDPVEMGVTGSEEPVLTRIRNDPDYRRLFRESFSKTADPAVVDLDRITRALAAFQRTLISGRSPYDDYLFYDNPESLTDKARRGMRLFFSPRLRCSECHEGLTFSGPVRTGEDASQVEPVFHNTGLYNVDGRGGYPKRDRGLLDRTGNPADMGRFRAPTLRNIAVTAPYMHDGSIPTLAAVLDHYAAGGRRIDEGPNAGDGSRNPLKAAQLTGFTLSEAERDDVIAFLGSLTDERFLNDPRFLDPFAEP